MFYRIKAYYKTTPGIFTVVVTLVVSASIFGGAGYGAIVIMWVSSLVAFGIIKTLVQDKMYASKQKSLESKKVRRDLVQIRADQQRKKLTHSAESMEMARQVVQGSDLIELAGPYDQNATRKLPSAVTTRLPENAYRGTHSMQLPTKYQSHEPVINWATKHRELYYRPHLSSVLGKAILCSGMRGSGKTNVAAVFIEQLADIGPLPMIIFDLMDDYSSLHEVISDCVVGGAAEWKSSWMHRGHYWVVDESNAQEVGYEILEDGWRLVLELGSYKDRNEAARVMVGVLEGMFAWAQDKLSGKERVPCLVFMDEAQQFLPQNRGSRLDKEEYGSVLNMFSQVNEVGRKLGFTPALFTQRIATIHNDVIEGSEIFIFMKQDLQADIDRYAQYLGKELGSRQNIENLQSGEGYVKIGDQKFKVKFDLRKSEHKGVTPGLEQALQRYQGKKKMVGDRVSSWVSEDDSEEDGQYQEENVRGTRPDNGTYYSPPANHQERSLAPSLASKVVSQKQKDAELLQQYVEIYLDGNDTYPKFQNVTGLTNHYARQWMPKVIAEVERLKTASAE